MGKLIKLKCGDFSFFFLCEKLNYKKHVDRHPRGLGVVDWAVLKFITNAGGGEKKFLTKLFYFLFPKNLSTEEKQEKNSFMPF